MYNACANDHDMDDFSQLSVLRDIMDMHTYEIKADFRAQLLGRRVPASNGKTVCLTTITGFETDMEEYTPSLGDDNALYAQMVFHVDGECEANGLKSEVRKLAVWFDFQYVNHDTGYTISDVMINCQ